MHSEPHAPGQGERGHGAMYVAVGVVSLVLTAIAFYVVYSQAEFRHYVVPIILVLAAIQVFLQTWLFMHLNTGRRLYQMIFGYGMFLALLVIFGSIEVLTSYKPPVAAPKKLSQAQMVALGTQIVTKQCEACHMVNGKGQTIGPNLNSVLAGSVNLVPGGKPTDSAWLTKWISDPQAVWSSATMPNLGLTPQQVSSVVLYLTTKVK